MPLIGGEDPNTQKIALAPDDPRNNFITVKRKKKHRSVEPALDALEQIPMFYPILKTSIGAPGTDTMCAELNSSAVKAMCTDYQNHLQATSEVTAKRQTVLASKLKWIDKNAAARFQRFNKAAQGIKRHEANLQTVTPFAAGVNKMQDAIQAITPLLAQLNNMLPEDARLEPFQFSQQQQQNDGGSGEESGERNRRDGSSSSSSKIAPKGTTDV